MSHSPRTLTTGLPAVADLRSRLDAALGDAARTWLDQAVTAAAASRSSDTATPAAPVQTAPVRTVPSQTAPAQAAPTQAPSVQATSAEATSARARAAAHLPAPGPTPSWELRFAEAGRRCGPEHADTARLVLLHAARADTATLARLYEQGTATERRAVLAALPHLVPGPDALPLVEDALRTNDTRLVAVALGPYAAEHLAPHDWRHAVLKCLFTGVPVDAVAGLAHRARADTELARMLGDYAAERTAAGRTVPGDLYRVLALTDPPTATDAHAPATTGPGDRAASPDHPAVADPDHPSATSPGRPAAPVPLAPPSMSTGEDQEY
ncbi:EboA domain-containing protein [Streptomyces alboflavus]|uniref:EboA domain-containing protein n=1 Tax=Streptomyces alboflavus TaxID=67267 RepID=UPI00068F203B|nr:EboA domain-containing protein [Streptomyces alboflavus]